MKNKEFMAGTSRVPLTEAEHDLLATPTAVLKARTFVFSFERDRFDRLLESTDPSHLVLHVHLYFDHVITAILIEALENPSAIKAKRLAFSQKAKLIEAMGLLPRELMAPIEVVNGMRNKFAHNLNFTISEKQISDLANCTPKYLKDVVLEKPDRARGPLSLRELLEVLLYQTELSRQRLAYRRLSIRKSEVRLRAVLQKEEYKFAE